MHEAGEASFPASPGNRGAPTPRIISQPGCRGSGRRGTAASAASGSHTAVWGGWKVWGDAFNEFRIKTMQQRISQRYLEQTLLLDDVSICPLPLKKRLECRDVLRPRCGMWAVAPPGGPGAPRPRGRRGRPRCHPGLPRALHATPIPAGRRACPAAHPTSSGWSSGEFSSLTEVVLERPLHADSGS